LSVTPLQLAAAYGAIANDGVLLQPTLIREVRDPSGAVRYRHRPEPVRRAVTPQVAARLRDLLRASSSGGTGERAALANFQLAAKTGTARRVVEGRYAPGQYTASFRRSSGRRPQLVVVMKIDNPQKGSYFAAQTAAPVTRSMLEQALAARTSPSTARASRTWRPRPSGRRSRSPTASSLRGQRAVPHPTAPAPSRRAPSRRHGRGLREAARTLHRRGFRVVVKGWGSCITAGRPRGRAPRRARP